MTMLLILLLQAVPASQPAPKREFRVLKVTPGPTDAQLCATMDKLARETTAELPKMVDAITRADGMVAICSMKTVNWSKFIKVPQSSLRDGWQARKQAQWNSTVCENREFRSMAWRGWRFSQALTWVSGERVVMDADCGPPKVIIERVK